MATPKKSRKKRKQTKKTTISSTARQFSRFEVLFVIVLFLCFFAWAFVKCNQGYAAAATENPDTAPQTEIEDNYSPAAGETPNSPGYDMGNVEDNEDDNITRNNTNNTRQGRNDNTASRKSYTPLYVTLQDLKVRKGPSLDSTIVAILNLHEEVMFMDKRTNFSQKINIGTETTDEPWIYIKTRKGHKGWVYGAGVEFFKWDRLKNPIRSLDDENSTEE